MNLKNRQYTESHINENLGDVTRRRFYNALLYECKIKKFAAAEFVHCVLSGTRLEPESLRDILGATFTLDCFSYGGVFLNELAFDAHLYLLSLTAGNDAKREKLREMIAPERMRFFERAFPATE